MADRRQNTTCMRFQRRSPRGRQRNRRHRLPVSKRFIDFDQPRRSQPTCMTRQIPIRQRRPLPKLHELLPLLNRKSGKNIQSSRIGH